MPLEHFRNDMGHGNISDMGQCYVLARRINQVLIMVNPSWS